MTGKCRIPSVVVLLLLFGLALCVSAGAGANATTSHAQSGATPRPGELAIVRAMNAIRVANGVPALRVGPRLTRAARWHSADMARRGYFDHGPFVKRLRRFGVRARFVGENLASGSQPLGASAIVQMWIASPGHRQNLLDQGFRRVGVGVAGGSTRMVTADFAGS